MNELSLNGAWTLTQADTQQNYPAQVPGCAHMDLMAADVLPDLWWRDNEAKHNWVWHKDWTYSRSFDISEEMLQADALLLRCEGLDTLAQVFINDQAVLQADNMHRTWFVDICQVAKVGSNDIRIEFAGEYALYPGQG